MRDTTYGQMVAKFREQGKDNPEALAQFIMTKRRQSRKNRGR